MKRFLFFLSFIIFALSSHSQVINNLVVFCNDGEPFTLIMNGEKYNLSPQTKLRVTGLTLKKYQVKIIFTNPKLKELNTTLTFFNTGYECEFALNKRGKKKYTMDFFTDKRIEGFDEINRKNEPQKDNTTNDLLQSTPVKSNTMNTSSNNTDNGNTPGTNASNPSSSPTNTALTGTGAIPSHNIPTIKNCDTPLSQAQFEKYKGDILRKTNDADKKVLATILIENHCLVTDQVKQLVDVFVADNVKLDIAKKAYDITKDYSNYSKLTDVFTNSGVKDEFKKFLSIRK
jgi:hypothetical protein